MVEDSCTKFNIGVHYRFYLNYYSVHTLAPRNKIGFNAFSMCYKDIVDTILQYLNNYSEKVVITSELGDIENLFGFRVISREELGLVAIGINSSRKTIEVVIE
jgi:hypothetical protein